MPDRKLVYEDPAPLAVATRVVERGVSGGLPWVRLEETPFYPGGGGQPADRGAIAGVDVVDVHQRGDQVLHFLARPVSGDAVRAEVEPGARLDRSQQHTAQHLVTAILVSRHGLPTTAFHLGEEYAAIEVPGPAPPVSRLEEFEEEVNEEIRRGRAVTSRWVAPEELARLPVRSRGLPEGHEGPVRLIEIEGIDLNTCGGTHVGNLAEIQAVHLLDAEAARGGARIRFLAGGRVFGRLRGARALESSLKARIGTAPSEFAGVLDGWEAERRFTERRIRELEADLAARIAAEVASGTGPRLARFIGGGGPELLRRIARAALGRRPDATVVLVGEDGPARETVFLVESGPAGPEDVAPLGRAVSEILGGRGGGRGRTFQGRGGHFDGEIGRLLLP